MPRSRIGETCYTDADCYTKNCVDGVCEPKRVRRHPSPSTKTNKTPSPRNVPKNPENNKKYKVYNFLGFSCTRKGCIDLEKQMQELFSSYEGSVHTDLHVECLKSFEKGIVRGFHRQLRTGKFRTQLSNSISTFSKDILKDLLQNTYDVIIVTGVKEARNIVGGISAVLNILFSWKQVKKTKTRMLFSTFSPDGAEGFGPHDSYLNLTHFIYDTDLLKRKRRSTNLNEEVIKLDRETQRAYKGKKNKLYLDLQQDYLRGVYDRFLKL